MTQKLIFVLENDVLQSAAVVFFLNKKNFNNPVNNIK